jgi:hypothetical protein
MTIGSTGVSLVSVSSLDKRPNNWTDFVMSEVFSNCMTDSPHITLLLRQQTLVSTLAIRPYVLVESVPSVSLK